MRLSLVLLVVLTTSSVFGVDKCARKIAQFADLSEEMPILVTATERWFTPFNLFGEHLSYATIDWHADDLALEAGKRRARVRWGILDRETNTNLISGTAPASHYYSPQANSINPSDVTMIVDGYPLVIDAAPEGGGNPQVKFNLSQVQNHRKQIKGVTYMGPLEEGDLVYQANRIEVSPNGQHILTTQGDDGYVHDSKTGKLRFHIRADIDVQAIGEFRSQLDADFSSDSRFVVVAHHYGMGTLWDTATGDLIWGFRTRPSSRYVYPGITASPYDNIFLISSVEETGGFENPTREHHAGFFEIVQKDGEHSVRPINTFTNINKALERSAPKLHRLGWHPPVRFGPGRQIIVGTEVGDAYVYDLDLDPAMKKPSTALEGGHEGTPITSAEFSPDGQFYATGSMSGDICVWSTHDHGENYRIKGNKMPISFLRFTKDGNTLIVHTKDPNVTGGVIDSPITHAFLIDISALEKKAIED